MSWYGNDKLVHCLDQILQNQSIKKDISSQVNLLRVPSHPRCRHARIEEGRAQEIQVLYELLWLPPLKALPLAIPPFYPAISMVTGTAIVNLV